MRRSKRLISMVLVLSMLLSMMGFTGSALAAESNAASEGTQRFTDVPPTHWAYEYVENVAEQQLFSGTGDGSTFSPDANMTRAMFVTVLSRVDGTKLDNAAETGFDDVAPGAWYSNAVVWAAGNDIVKGTGNGMFSPDMEITREQMAVMLVRYAEYAGIKLEEAEESVTFTDASSISDWAADAVALCQHNGFITGYTDGSFGPKNHATRAEVAVVISKFVKVAGIGTSKESFLVTFETNGGSKVAAQSVMKGTYAEEPNNPVRSGYTFAGWYTDSKLTQRFNFATPVTADITLYARWNKSSSGGSSGGSEVKKSVELSEIPDLPGLKVGQEQSITAVTDPEDAVLTAVSSDPDVVTVTVNGHEITLVGVAKGSTAVTVTAAKDGYIPASNTFAVAVDEDMVVTSGSRVKYNFNMGWKFIKAEPEGPSDHTDLYGFNENPPVEAEYDDTSWEDVNLPHSYNEEDSFDDYLRNDSQAPRILDTDGTYIKTTTHPGERDMYTGKTWYRKDFTVPANMAGKRVFIEIEAARQAAEVYVNGVKLEGKCENGFIPFGYDLTDYLNPAGENNTIAIMVDNTFPYRTTEYGEIDWSKKNDYILSWHDSHWQPTYGGLYRNVYLYVTDPLHITLPLYSFLETQGTYVYTFDEQDTTSGVAVEAEIYNQYNTEKTFTYQAQVLDMDGNVVLTKSTDVTLPANTKTSDLPAVEDDNIRDGRVFVEGVIENAKRWSPEYPYLYTVVSSILVDGEEIDRTEDSLGIRTWEFTIETGFYINEDHTKLEGWGQRPTEEWAGLASAYPDWMHDFTMKQMKDAGANYIRWGHCAGGPITIELADKYGIITTQAGVDGEGHLSSGYGYSDISYQVRDDAFRDMVIYYRNHPSILLWEYGNQPVRVSYDEDGNARDNVQIMDDIVSKWDPRSRKSSKSNDLSEIESSETSGRERTAREGGDYTAQYLTVIETTDGDRVGKGKLPILESEYDRAEAPRRVWDRYTPGYEDYVGQGTYKDFTSEKFATNAANTWLAMTPVWHSGGANWIYSDSTSHGRNFSEVTRATGEVDAVRLEKEAYWALSTIWTDDPDCYIIGHWNYPEGTVKPIYVMSDAAQVALFVNGEQVGETNAAPENKYCFKFDNVAWESGTIKAVGYDKNGNEICSYEKTTHGDPVAVKLTPIEGPDGLLAGGDVMLVDVEVVDANGNRCLTFDGKVEFDISQFTDEGTGIWRGGYSSGFGISQDKQTDLSFINDAELYVEAGINRVAIRTTEKAGEITLGAKVVGIGTAEPDAELTTNGVEKIAPATLTVTSKAVDNEGGLSITLPKSFEYDFDFSEENYPGIGTGYIEETEDEMESTSALIKDFSLTGGEGSISGKYPAKIVNPAAVGEPAYNDNGKTHPELVFGDDLPQYVLNGDYVLAPNTDRNYDAGDFIMLSAGRDILLTVAYDDRIQTKAEFLDDDELIVRDGQSVKGGFKDTGDNIVIGGITYSLYTIDMLKGDTIRFTGNKQNPDEEGNLFIIFAKEARLVDKFLYDDFEMQNEDEKPEGWIYNVPAGTDVTVATVEGADGEQSNVIHLTDTVSSSEGYALISRKFSPLTEGKYSIKWKMRENGESQKYTRILLHSGAPKSDTMDYSGFVLETYLHDGNLMYRTQAGNDKTNKTIGAITPNVWHEVELLVDLDAKTFDAYIDGVKMGGTNNLTDTSGRAIDHIIIGTRGKGPGDLYFDDISITPIEENIEISGDLQNVADLVKGKTNVQTVTVTPSGAVVTVTSSDDQVATAAYADGEITVTGVAAGEATITVKAVSGNLSREKSFKVSVIDQPKTVLAPIANINDLKAGEQTEVSVSVTPADATVAVASSDDNVATVAYADGKITVTGVAAGEATVTVAASKDGYSSAETTFTVKVLAGETKVLFSEDFSAYEVGSELATDGSWTVSKSTASNLSATIEKATVNGVEKNVVHVVDTANATTGKGNINLACAFEAQKGGKVIIEWSMKEAMVGPYVRMIAQDGVSEGKPMGNEAQMAMELYFNKGTLGYRDDTIHNTADLKSLGTVTTDWYQMKAVLDLDTQTYDLYLNGTLVGEGLGFRQIDTNGWVKQTVDQVDWFILGSSNSDNSDFYVTDIVISSMA